MNKSYDVHLKFGGQIGVYHIELQDGAQPRTTISDGGDPFLWVAGIGWADAQLAAIVGVHRRAVELGRSQGRLAQQQDMLRVLGAQPKAEGE